jgi:hypothetical protein
VLVDEVKVKQGELKKQQNRQKQARRKEEDTLRVK